MPIQPARPTAELAGVREREVQLLLARHAPALEVLRVELAESLDLGLHDLLDLVDVRRVRHGRRERDEPGVVQLPDLPADRRRELGLDELAVQAPARLAREHRRGGLERRVVRRRTARAVIRDRDDVLVAGPLEHDAPLAVLLRLDGVGVGQRARRLRDRAERLVDRRERGRHLELSGDDHGRVVGLVVAGVERAQRARRHPLDIRARARDRSPVRVPQIRGLADALGEDPRRLALPVLELVADDRELGLEIVVGDRRVRHHVGVEVERPVEVVLARRERRVELRGVVRRQAVLARGAAVLEELPHAAVARAALEHHVLDQVGHAGLAVALLARADVDHGVDGEGRSGGVGDEQDLEAVGEPVLGHAFDRPDLGRRGEHGAGKSGE